MRTRCHSSLGFLLKVLNFLQAFIGISIFFYSLWMLNQWNHHIPIPSPPAPSPDSSQFPFLMLDTGRISSDKIYQLDFAADMVSGSDDNGLMLNFINLPAPWFIYLFMGVGIVVCCITCVGHIAAEAINGCCLCFYTLLSVLLILLEAGLIAFVAFDHHWEKDLPFDPTGELDSLRSFIENNIDICKWVGITVVSIQALSLLLAMILRAMVTTQKTDYDIEDDYATAGTREPLLNPQLSQTSGSSKGDGKGAYVETWSSRMRDKYTLLSVLLILLEAGLIAFVAFDHHWEKDLPFDPTGELDSLRSFIENNIDICKWVGITVVSIQALSLLLAMILRAMVTTQKTDYDIEDDYATAGTREPLLNPQLSQTSGSSKGDGKGAYVETWSSRMRDKYTLLSVLLILLEAGLIAFVAFDHHWEKDLPFDPTGELDSLRSFIENNIDICKWVGITVVSIQALSLLLAMILRAMVTTQKTDYDIEDDYATAGTREPLLNPQLSQTSGSSKGDGKGAYVETWSSRMRDKYGLNRGSVKV